MRLRHQSPTQCVVPSGPRAHQQARKGRTAAQPSARFRRPATGLPTRRFEPEARPGIPGVFKVSGGCRSHADEASDDRNSHEAEQRVPTGGAVNWVCFHDFYLLGTKELLWLPGKATCHLKPSGTRTTFPPPAIRRPRVDVSHPQQSRTCGFIKAAEGKLGVG